MYRRTAIPPYCHTAILIIFLLAIRVHAGPVLDTPETWDSGLAGWTNTTGFATMSNPSNYLRITFGSQSGEPVYEEDTIFSSGADFTGNYQTSPLPMAVTFSFYVEDVLPLSTVLYLHSPTNDNRWEYALTNLVVDSWIEQEVIFSYSAGWSGPGGASEFWSDLADIDWIGINIARKLDTIQQVYGIDNWMFFVIPEPGTVCMLASAFISLAFTFRKRLRGQGVV